MTLPAAGPIDSPRNSRVVAARALHTRKGRTAAGAFLVEGPHAVSEVLDADGFEVREVFLTDLAAERDVELLRRLAGGAVPIHTVSDRVARALGDTTTPQGIIAVASRRPAGAATLPAAPRLVAVLDRCADPGNAGTAIRTAAAAGADAVVISAGSVDVFSGKCIRASAGGIFQLPVVTSLPTTASVAALRAAGCRVWATASDGADDLDDLIDAGELTGATAWLFGNESHGLDEGIRAMVDRTVRIRLHGRAESLNLASSVAVCLFASARANRPDGSQKRHM